jgi:selenide,water dikinase
VSPARLAGILQKLPRVITPDLLVDMDTMDDAGVFRLSPDLALVQTVDFFPPIVNDPKTFGRIVAANSLSDVWAMGGTALTAMNVLAYPSRRLPAEAVEQLLIGASEKLQEAGVALVGGHTMDQQELFYGLSVTGTVHPGKILTNARARVGHHLILTKPLGVGVYSDAFAKDGLTAAQYGEWVASMERLNLYASRVLGGYSVSAMTDVTGFGLLGHALAIARNAGVTLRFFADAVPSFSGVYELMGRFAAPRISEPRQYVQPFVRRSPDLSDLQYDLLVEPQTSGGLLAAIPAGESARAVSELKSVGDSSSAVIGEVIPLQHGENGDPLYLSVVVA